MLARGSGCVGKFEGPGRGSEMARAQEPPKSEPRQRAGIVRQAQELGTAEGVKCQRKGATGIQTSRGKGGSWAQDDSTHALEGTGDLA